MICSKCGPVVGLLNQGVYACPIRKPTRGTTTKVGHDCHGELQIVSMSVHGGSEHWLWRCYICHSVWLRILPRQHSSIGGCLSFPAS